MEKGDMKESQPNSRCQTPEPLESFMSAGLVESTADNADSKILGGMCKESSKEPREAIPSKALPTRRRKRSDTRSDVAFSESFRERDAPKARAALTTITLHALTTSPSPICHPFEISLLFDGAPFGTGYLLAKVEASGDENIIDSLTIP
mmetsp:Transcript_43612/g.74481  ORF Transcript_43612/g.74481 Transcript_43612/m.74481 type:complete len:149 (+) Transcript_43612:509-955(+)